MSDSNNIRDVVEVSRLIANRPNQLNKIVLKKLFIMTMACVDDPTEEMKKEALLELQKSPEKRNMAPIIGDKNIIKIDKQQLFKYLGIDCNKYNDAYDDYYSYFKELIKASNYTFSDGESYASGFFLTRVYTRKSMHTFNIYVDPEYMPIFWNLKGGYVKLLTEDVGGFECIHTMPLYTFIMSHADKHEVNFTTQQLKSLFGLDVNSYVRKNGKFGRNDFEKATINVALKELDQKCKSISIIKQLDNGVPKLYSKTKKKNGRVEYYVIKYMVHDPYEVVRSQKEQQEQDTLNGQLSINDFSEEVKNMNPFDNLDDDLNDIIKNFF